MEAPCRLVELGEKKIALERYFQTSLDKMRVVVVDEEFLPCDTPGFSNGNTIYLRSDLMLHKPLFDLCLAHETTHFVQKNNNSAPASGNLIEAEASLSAVRFVLGMQPIKLSRDTKQAPRMFGPAGHYFTSLYMNLAAGASWAMAADIALATQLADQVEELDATDVILKWGRKAVTITDNPIVEAVNYYLYTLPYPEIARKLMFPDPFIYMAVIQRGLHCLKGGKGTARQEQDKRAKLLSHHTSRNDAVSMGINLHALGDSFAHVRKKDVSTLYETGLGHAAEGVNAYPGGAAQFARDLLRTLAPLSNPIPLIVHLNRALQRIGPLMHEVDNINFQPKDRYLAYINKSYPILVNKFHCHATIGLDVVSKTLKDIAHRPGTEDRMQTLLIDAIHNVVHERKLKIEKPFYSPPGFTVPIFTAIQDDNLGSLLTAQTFVKIVRIALANW